MMNPHDGWSHNTPGTGFTLDPKALTVAGVAMGMTLALWALQGALSSMFGGTGPIIILLLLAVGGGYAVYRNRNPEQAHYLGARVQHATQSAAGRLSAAAEAGPAPPPVNAPIGGPAFLPPQSPAQFSGIGTPQQPALTAALVSAALLIPSLIAYAAMHQSPGFTDPWQPWWILTGLYLYFVACVAFRARTGARRSLAILLGLIGTGLIALANNPSGDVNLLAMLSSKRYYEGISYPVPPSPDVTLWISRVPMLATLIFVASWGIARRRRPGWVLGLIPTGLLVWWAIYGAEHPSGWQGGWFQAWVITVGTFVGGCVCCWLAELLTSGGRGNTAAPRYAPPVWNGPLDPPETPTGPPIGTQPPVHADYRDQAARHFHGPPSNPTTYCPGQTYGRGPGGQR